MARGLDIFRKQRAARLAGGDDAQRMAEAKAQYNAAYGEAVARHAAAVAAYHEAEARQDMRGMQQARNDAARAKLDAEAAHDAYLTAQYAPIAQAEAKARAKATDKARHQRNRERHTEQDRQLRANWSEEQLEAHRAAMRAYAATHKEAILASKRMANLSPEQQEARRAAERAKYARRRNK